jgi:adenylylsulfate kinase
MSTLFMPGQKTQPSVSISSRISILAVQNYGISGTLFLQSLLDGHPHVLSTPALYSHDFFSFWEAYGNKDPKEFVNLFMIHHAHWFSPDLATRDHGLHQMGPNMDEAVSVDAGKFREALSEFLEETGERMSRRKAYFVGVFGAYSRALERKVAEPAVVVFPIHSLPERHAGYLLEDFQAVKFLHMVRDPVQNIGSMVKHIIHNKLSVNPMECAFSQVVCDYTMHWGNGYYARGDRPFFPEAADRSRAVRLEDLHNRPKETLQAICRWVGIPWDDCLLTSTFDGKKWWNRPESPRVSGFGTETIQRDRHRDVTSPFDRARFQGILWRKAVVWGYTAPRYVRSLPFRFLLPFLLLLPFRAERYQAGVHDVRRERIARLVQKMREAGRRPWRRLTERKNEFLRFGPELAKKVVALDGKRGPQAFFQSAGLNARLHLAASAFVAGERMVELRPARTQKGDIEQLEKATNEREEQNLGAFWLLIGKAGLAIRDYIAPRVWLLRGWADGFRRKRSEVRLLDAAPGAMLSSRESGTVYWITGLSGSGKTTIGRELYKKIASAKSNVVFLDGDELRGVLGAKAGYTAEERRALALTYARLCKLLADQGIDVVCATVSMFHETRRWNRANHARYQEIYVKASFGDLLARDSKGLYRRALDGEVSDVIGVDLPVEEPESPDAVLENGGGADVSQLVDDICAQMGVGIDEHNAGR